MELQRRRDGGKPKDEKQMDREQDMELDDGGNGVVVHEHDDDGGNGVEVYQHDDDGGNGALALGEEAQ